MIFSKRRAAPAAAGPEAAAAAPLARPGAAGLIRTGGRVLIAAALAGYFVYAVGRIDVRRSTQLYDFKTFYFAGKAWSQGLNPYSLTALREVAKRPVLFRFVHPPQTLWLWRLLSGLPLPTAATIFLLVKVALLAGLVFLWWTSFLRAEGDAWFPLFILLAFAEAVYLDLVCGNISIPEQFGLWLGFHFLLKRRPVAFAACVILIANFKITPAVFLLLPLAMDIPRKRRLVLGSLGAFAAMQGFAFLATPLYREFLYYAWHLSDSRRGMSLAYLVRPVLEPAFGGLGQPASRALLAAALLAAMTGIAVLAWRGFRSLSVAEFPSREEGDRFRVFLACVVYALLLPRFPTYAQIVLIPPAYFALKRLARPGAAVFLFLLAVLDVPERLTLPGLTPVLTELWRQHGVLVAIGLLALFLRRAAELRTAAAAARPALPAAAGEA